jgi:hypothetical protein
LANEPAPARGRLHERPGDAKAQAARRAAGISLLKAAMAMHRVDPDPVCVTGLSCAGSLRHPRVAAKVGTAAVTMTTSTHTQPGGGTMKRALRTLAVLGSLCLGLTATAAAGEAPIEPQEKMDLFNGRDFSGWILHLRGDADVAQTWKVEDGIIKCSGRPPGYMRTEKPYKNYKLTVEWRFTKPGNSGILVHMSLPDKVWPRSIECQGMSNNQGDFFVIDGTEFKEHLGVKGRRVPKRGPANEKPLGEWNVYEVVCKGDTVRPYVNGKLMNEATECNVDSGMICLQSEGAVWECRKITIEPAD